MQVLILGDDHGQQARLAAAMMKKGFQVICVESAGAAGSYIRGQFIDVLILAETRSGRIGQSCACVAQSRNPQVSVIVITDRTGAATQELFDEVPSLYGVIGLEMSPGMVAAIALASIMPQGSGLHPVAAPSQPALTQQPEVAIASLADTARPVAPRPVPARADPAQVTRTLLQPIARPAAGAAMAMPLRHEAPEPARRDGPVAAPVRTPVGTAASPGHALGTTPHTARSALADFKPELAALERDLDLATRDWPSVLAASIAEELPSWSHPAPKLALLTDWTPLIPAPTPAPIAAPIFAALPQRTTTGSAAAQGARSLALGAAQGLGQVPPRGVTLQ